MLEMKKLWEAIYKSAYYTIHHDGIEHAGYLAFLGMLSFFPFLVFLVAIAGSLGQSQIGVEFVNIMLGNLPEDVIAALKPRIQEIVSGPPQSLLTVAIIGVIWTASSAVEGTRTILNRAYCVATPPAYIWRRLMSIGQFLIFTFALTIAISLLVFAPVMWEKAEKFFDLEGAIAPSWTYVRYGLSAGTLFLVVAATYVVLPNIKQRWVAVLPGTIVVMGLWVLAAMILSAYIHNFDQVNLVYGSLEGIIVSLLFFYVLAVIYIFGAELNYHIEQALGYKMEEKEKVPKSQRRRRKTD